MLRRRSRRQSAVLAYRREWLLCHRGADRSVITEIVKTLEANDQTVIVQEHDHLWMSLAEFREFISDEIDGGSRYFIILLNEHLTGPMFRETFGPIRRQVGYTVAFYKMRIGNCDTTGVDDLVELADIRDPDMRRREIESICPTDRARCCGRDAA
jgi:hypothetical protein